MRWLLRKDLLILRRSRLLVGLLVVYPLAIALLIGLALSRGPSRPRVAIVDETPPGATVKLGSHRVAVGEYAHALFNQVQAVSVATRAQAVAKVRSGQVVAAVVIPDDLAAKLGSVIEQAHLEVLYDGNAIEQSLVRSSIGAAVAQANLTFSEQVQSAAASAIKELVQGGDLRELGAGNLIGLREIPTVLRAVIARQPPGHDRAQLERVDAFAGFAVENLSIAGRVLSTIGQPIAVHTTLLSGRRTPLNTFAVAVAASVSLMFVAVLLAAFGVALEREEHVLARLVRGPPSLVSRWTLIAEKSLLAGAAAFALAFVLLAAVGAFVTLEWSRVGLWALALAAAALAFGALGVALGAAARDVRAAALLALLLSLPLAFLALVPAGAVSGGFYDAIGVVSFAFPFKAALDALDTAVNGAAPSLGASIAHLAGLALAFAVLARASLARAD